MEYKDFFLHLQKKSKENRMRNLAEDISRKIDGVSVVQALSAIKQFPKSVLKEWKNAESQKSKTALLKRLKDSADAPSVGDDVKIEFDEASRGFLTPRQEEADGSVGTVKERQSFKTGSQFARYTVELKNSDQRVYNLTPGEVVPTDE